MPEAAPAAAASAPDRLPREVRGLGAVSLFNDFASEMVYPVLPAFITGPLGGSAVALGALDGAADLASAAVKWASGRLADRPGWTRPLIAAGYAAAVLVRPLMAAASAAGQVVGLRVVDRLGKGLRSPARDALIAGVTPARLRGRAFGFHRGADHLGAVLGSLVAWGMLSSSADPRTVIAWSAAPGVAALAVLAVVLRWTGGPADRRAMRVDGPGDGPAGGQADRTGAAFWLPVAVLVLLTAARLPETLLLLRLQDVGVPVAMIPLAWGALHVIRSASSYPGGALADRFGVRGGLAVGSLVYASVLGLLAAVSSPAVAAAAFLAHGIGAGLTEPAERLAITRLAPVRTGRGFGSYQALAGIAALPAGIGFGWMYRDLGGSTALTGSAIVLAIGAMLWLAVAQDPEPRPRVP
ncbi:MAG TPA: MFS transporter [Gemmatimonadales bacterium]|nr:MFS transporter [Gemmatimonadales bacterium]